MIKNQYIYRGSTVIRGTSDFSFIIRIQRMGRSVITHRVAYRHKYEEKKFKRIGSVNNEDYQGTFQQPTTL